MNELYREMVIANIKNTLQEAAVAKKYDNQVLKGRAREIFISNLLQPFLNPTIGTCTGIIIDSNGKHSNQIDIIIYDKNVIPPFLLTKGEGIIPIESVLAAVEVKSKLNKRELLKSIVNARSIKTLYPFFNEIKSTGVSKNSPVCYVFSFGSYLKKKSEYEILTELVKAENDKKNNVSIHVPISGICITNKIFLHCTNAQQNPQFKTVNAKNEYDVVLEFLVHLLNAINMLSQQRDRIFIDKYLK